MPGRHRRPDNARAKRPRSNKESTGWMVVEGIRVVLVMTLMTVLSLGAWVVVPMTWGWDAYTVTSGSMTPLVRPGDVIVAAASEDQVKVGNVVVIAPPRQGAQPITHRIVERLPDGR